MKRFIKKILVRLFSEKRVKTLAKKFSRQRRQIFFFQRILRINSKVPWPVHWTSLVQNPENINRKDPKSATPGFMPGCYIQAINGIEVGKNLYVGPGVKIISADHDVYEYEKHIKCPPVILGDNCWLGCNCVILPSVELGNHTIVAAGSVVTKSFKEGDCTIGGVPAKILKKLGSYPQTNTDK